MDIEIDELIALVAAWRESSNAFAKNQQLMESSPHPLLHISAKIQQGWAEALDSCADKLEKILTEH